MTEYWGGRPPCRSLRFLEVPEAAARANGLLSGEYDMACDILPDQIATIEASGRHIVRGGPVPNHRIVNFDAHHPAFADPRVRLAMAHAVDGRAIVDSLLCTAMTASTDMTARRNMFARMLQVCEREDPAYLVLHQNANFTGVRSSLPWQSTASFDVDLSPRGLA